jgi:hypothetical protein
MSGLVVQSGRAVRRHRVNKRTGGIEQMSGLVAFSGRAVWRHRANRQTGDRAQERPGGLVACVDERFGGMSQRAVWLHRAFEHIGVIE